jgi:hypothetical protein
MGGSIRISHPPKELSAQTMWRVKVRYAIAVAVTLRGSSWANPPPRSYPSEA